MWFIFISIIVLVIIAFIVNKKHNKEDAKDKATEQQQQTKDKATEQQQQTKDEETEQQQQTKDEETEQMQQDLQKIESAIKEGWALCLSKTNDEPLCIIHIEEKHNTKVVVRQDKGKELESLFVINKEITKDDGCAFFGLHQVTGEVLGLCIQVLDEYERKKYPQAKCSLTLFTLGDEKNGAFYFVVKFLNKEYAQHILDTL